MEGPPLGPVGEDITWPDQVAPRGRKASSTRKIKPQTSNQSTAPVMAVPCSPMPMVTSVNEVAGNQVCSHPASVCHVYHVLHGRCPDVMTLGSQRRTVASYSGGEGQARCYEARCLHPPWGQPCPELGTLTGPDPWGSTLPYRVTIPLSVLRMSLCVSLHSPAWLPETGLR